MAYLVAGGADRFRDDTKKLAVNVGLIKIKVSGTHLVPIIDALRHYEAVAHSIVEREAALCSVISKCRKWKKAKDAKAAATANPDATVKVRQLRVTELMNEAAAALIAGGGQIANAFDAYSQRKDRGALDTRGLSPGYANERLAYLASGKTKSLSGSLIDDLVSSPNHRTRTGGTLSPPSKAELIKKFDGRSLDSLTVKDWAKIEKIASELDGHMLETKYMTRHERLKCMLESDGNGGLRYIVGHRSAAVPQGQVWPYAMDEWGNLYTADDRTEQSKGGYAMFNHSSFTAGDTVVCAGMLEIDAAGKLLFIDTNSGHYKPTKQQLQAVIQVLRQDYEVDFRFTEISTAEPRVLWGGGEVDRFMADQEPLIRPNRPLPQPPQ